jgi:hypothetical protein
MKLEGLFILIGDKMKNSAELPVSLVMPRVSSESIQYHSYRPFHFDSFNARNTSVY